MNFGNPMDWKMQPDVVRLSAASATELRADDGPMLVFVRSAPRNAQWGWVDAKVGQRWSPARSGLIAFLIPGAVQGYRATEDLSLGMIRIAHGYLEQLGRDAYGEEALQIEDFLPVRNALMSRRLNEFVDRALDPLDPPSTLEMNARAVLIGTKLIRDYSTSRQAPGRQDGGLPARSLRRVVAYIDENLSRPIGLAELSTIAGVSRFHFCRAFKVSTGASPTRWIQAKRIRRAEELLLNTDEGVLDIAARLGYASVGHFSRVFRRHAGMTPSDFRRRD